MSRSAFPYPGGKTRIIDWILQQIPEHYCFVVPFGGSATTLLNKPRSHVEVYNDTDAQLVNFYEIVRSRPDELRERLRQIPYAREIHELWSRHLNEDGPAWPDGDVERAARWFYLRFSQHSAKLTSASGFKTSRKTNPASAYYSGLDQLEQIADRFDRVVIESDDYAEIARRYDGPDTVIYFDPPYLDAGDGLYTHSGAFDHAELCRVLDGLESDWIVSYREVPDELDEYRTLERSDTYRSAAREGENCEDATERLVLNYNPDQRVLFTGVTQSGLDSFGGDRS